MVTKTEPSVTFHGEINLERLAWILGKIKSKQVGYPVTARIRPMEKDFSKRQNTKELA